MSQTSKRFLIVDAWVIAKASEQSSDDVVWKAADILSRILHVCHKIVLDIAPIGADTILDEYSRQAKSEFARRWITAMQIREDKIVYRHRSTITISALTDPDDLKYFQVATNSPHKTIISEDSDLTSIRNDPQVVGLQIHIWNLDDALANL